ERAHARDDHPPDLFRRQPLTGASRRFASDAALAASAFARAGSAAPPSSAQAAAARATLSRTEPATHAHAEAGVERAGAEGNARIRRATAARPAAAQAEPHALTEDEVFGTQAAESVGDGAERAQRLLHLVAALARERFGHAAESRADVARVFRLFGTRVVTDLAFLP